MADLRLDDIYGGLVMPWQVDRKDVNQPHGSEWDADLSPDFWVSTDTGKVCFAPVPEVGGGALREVGQHYKEVGGDWRLFPNTAEAPGNIGGFHACCARTSQTGTAWTLVAKLSDFGLVLGRDAGLRVEFAALVRDDCEAILASVGSHDECRSLFCVEQVVLPTGRLLLGDPAECTTGDGFDGPAVPSGMGAGYYPVFISRDAEQQVCRITVAFHPDRAGKVCKRFPPGAVE